jgi:hypothetical protein
VDLTGDLQIWPKNNQSEFRSTGVRISQRLSIVEHDYIPPRSFATSDESSRSD